MASMWLHGDDSPIDLCPVQDISDNDDSADGGEENDVHEKWEQVVEPEHPKKVIKALSPFSRLLIPTESFLGKEQPLYSRSSHRTKSPPKRASTGSAQPDDSESRYRQLTASASRRAELSRQKKEPVPVDPRESAWDATPLKSGDPPIPSPTIESDPTDLEDHITPNQPTLYPPPPNLKNVRSKLFEPTTASATKVREYRSISHSQQRPISPNRIVSQRKEELGARCKSPDKRSNRYNHISSRLYEYTESRKAFLEKNKVVEVQERSPRGAVIKKSQSCPPACAEKVTKAVIHGRREKYNPEVVQPSTQRHSAGGVNSALPPPACADKITQATQSGKRGKFDCSDPLDVGSQSRQNRTSPVRIRTGSTSSVTSSLSCSTTGTTNFSPGGGYDVATSPPPPPPLLDTSHGSPRASPKTYTEVAQGGSASKRLSPSAASISERRRAVDVSTNEWRQNEAMPYALSCLRIMQGYVPPKGTYHSTTDLQELGLSPVLAFRIMTKRCLWLVRETPASIAADTSTDFVTRYDYSKQGLDIVELAAVYACLPARFDAVSAEDGRRERWRGTLEYQLKRLMKQKEYASFPAELRRNSAYEGQDPIFSCDSIVGHVEKNEHMGVSGHADGGLTTGIERRTELGNGEADNGDRHTELENGD